MLLLPSANAIVDMCFCFSFPSNPTCRDIDILWSRAPDSYCSFGIFLFFQCLVTLCLLEMSFSFVLNTHSIFIIHVLLFYVFHSKSTNSIYIYIYIYKEVVLCILFIKVQRVSVWIFTSLSFNVVVFRLLRQLRIRGICEVFKGWWYC